MAKEHYHEVGLVKILNAVIRYECGFCGQQFTKLSDCALHIEKESLVGFANPADIKITVLRSKKGVKYAENKNQKK